MISHINYIQELHKGASMLQWILRRFNFSHEFEIRLEKNLIEEGPSPQTSDLRFLKMLQKFYYFFITNRLESFVCYPA